MILAKDLVEKLSSFYSDEGVERGGYLTQDDVFECENVHVNKIEGFCFSFDDLDKLEEDEKIIATFHTHPNGFKNLSKEDFTAFTNWSTLLHFIIGKDGISCYKVTDRNTVVIEDVDVR